MESMWLTAQVAGALVALVGVAGTLVVNGLLARRADEHRARDQSERRDEERQHRALMLRTTLHAALEQLVATMHGELRYTRARTGDIWVPLLDYFSAYRKNEDSLGLLTQDEVRALAAAYYTYQTQIGFAARVGEWNVQRDAEIGGSLLVPADKAPWLEGCLDQTYTYAKIAYEVLARELAGTLAADNRIESIAQPGTPDPADKSGVDIPAE